MKHVKIIKIIVAIVLALTFGLFTPYIYTKYTKYNIIRLIVSVVIIDNALYKLSKGIKIKQYDLSYIISKLMQISTFIGILLVYIIEDFF